jgi:Xaa-Pro aminopeptidase
VLHDAAVGVLIDGLRELGVLRGSREELLEQEAHKPFFPHRTSHWLGLDTHDPGDYVRSGTPRPLEPGMVLTVEPGLYFPLPDEPDQDEDPAAPFRGMGVRIEDTVLVTGDGCEVLTGALPTGPDEVEALVRG